MTTRDGLRTVPLLQIETGDNPYECLLRGMSLSLLVLLDRLDLSFRTIDRLTSTS